MPAHTIRPVFPATATLLLLFAFALPLPLNAQQPPQEDDQCPKNLEPSPTLIILENTSPKGKPSRYCINVPHVAIAPGEQPEHYLARRRAQAEDVDALKNVMYVKFATERLHDGSASPEKELRSLDDLANKLCRAANCDAVKFSSSSPEPKGNRAELIDFILSASRDILKKRSASPYSTDAQYPRRIKELKSAIKKIREGKFDPPSDLILAAR